MRSLIAPLLALALLSPLARADDQAAKLAELQALIQRLQTELSAAKSSRDALQGELQTSETDISGLLQRIEQINRELAAQKKS